MEQITAATSLLSEPARTASSSETDMGSQEFLNLLVLQLKNQDPLDPMDNEKFITQLTQLQTLEQQRQMTQATTSLILQQKITSSANMIGRTVRGTVTEGMDQYDASGTVERVTVQDDDVILKIHDSESDAVFELHSEDILEIY